MRRIIETVLLSTQNMFKLMREKIIVIQRSAYFACLESFFLAHRIRISDILENLILPMLSYPGSHCYVKVTSSCEIAS